MKRFTFILGFLVIIPFFLYSQVITVFHENFELPSLGDSVVSSLVAVPGVNDWGISTTLHSQGSRSDSCRVITGKTTELVSSTFSTVGYFEVKLKFSQICKIDVTDKAQIFVSADGGTTWSLLTGPTYEGGATQFAMNGSSFSANSYGLSWSPGNATAKPNSTWWRNEQFSLSALVGNCPTVKFKFQLKDAGALGGQGYGWLIDDIKVTMSYSELTPPLISLIDPPINTLFHTGPFPVKAKITDASGIDTAYLIYNINSGINDTIGMYHYTNSLDTMKVLIPAVNDSDVVCYHVLAYDGSPAENSALNPVSGCNQFIALAGITFPFFDNFDVFDIWTPAGSGSVWQRGTPSYGVTNSAHSTPNAWDINLNSTYTTNANSTLTSPVFDFTGAVNAKLSFWINYRTENNCDGTRLQYSTNGTNWTTIGTTNDPLGTNWYNGTLNSGGPAWDDNSNGWINAKYKLSILNNISPTVRLRYVFISDGSSELDGVSIDDFSISLPASQEIAINNIITPVSDCGLGIETVKIDMINVGLNAINGGLTAYYRKGNGPIIQEPVTTPIPVGDTIEYSFTTPVNMIVGQADSNFTIKAWVTLANDPMHFDDTTTKVITSKYVPNPPVVANSNITYGTSTTITAVCPNPMSWYDVPTGGTPISSTNSYTTPLLYGTTVYYVECVAPNGCKSPRIGDTVFVGNPPAFDGSALSLDNPNSGNNLTASEPVTLKIKNYGTQPITNIQVSYSINGGAVIQDIIPITMNFGDDYTHTFTQNANLYVFNTYNFKAWITVPGDNNHINDTVFKTVTNNPYVYCISAATSTNDDDIGNITVSNLNNGIPVPQTSNSNANQLYNDYSLTFPPIILVKGQTYPISITPIFSGSSYNNCVKVFIDWNYDGSFDETTETAFSSGSITTGVHSGNITVPLTAVTGLVRFRAVLKETSSQSSVHPCGTYTWGETEDYIAYVQPQIPNDASVLSFIQPPVMYPENLSAPVSVVVKNVGTDPINSIVVSYVLDNNPPVSTTYSSLINPGSSATVTFMPFLTWPVGAHSLCVYPTLAGDSNSFNDTLCGTFTGIRIDSIPYYNYFDGSAAQDFVPTSATGTSWILGTPTAGNFPTQGPSSQPNIWATNLNISSGYTPNATCYLTTQIFDFTNGFNTRLKFKYTMNSSTSEDGTRVEYSTDAGYTWNNLGILNDPLGVNWNPTTISSASGIPGWSGTELTWKEAKFKLSSLNYAPSVRFRFTFTSNSYTELKGFAIDDFSLTIPCNQDAGIDSILQPSVTESTAGTALTVQVRVVNYGIDTLTSIPVNFLVGQTLVPATFIPGGLGLLPEQSKLFTFTTQLIPPVGSYVLKVYTSLADDCDHMNDTIMKSMLGIPTYTVPYIDHFDSLNYTEWYTNTNQWEHGAPTSSVINTPYSTPYCWKTNLDGIYVKNNLTDYLYSPMFDFTQGVDSIVFKHWVHIYGSEGGMVEYLSSSGSWMVLGGMGNPNGFNWYNNGTLGFTNTGGLPGWHESSFDLKGIIDFAIPTQFRFKFRCLYTNTAWDGWAIDDFKLTTPKIPIDAGVINIIQPSGSTIYGTDLNVTVTVKNFGTDTLTTIPLKFQINGITVGVGTWSGSLAPEATANFVFPPFPSPLDNFSICAYTDLAFDSHFTNDTSCNYINVSPPPFDVAVTGIIEPIYTSIHLNETTVKVKIKNFGQTAVTDVPVAYGIGGVVLAQENWQGPALNTGDETEYTFNQKYTFDYIGFYELCSFTDLIADGYRKNDTACKIVEEKYNAGFEELNENGVGLSQNLPNPADKTSQILFYLPKPGDVSFEVVNYLGQLMYSQSSKAAKGENEIIINTEKMPAGMYYYYIIYNDKRYVRKMIVNH